MDFKPNINPVEIIKKGVFGGTYFRDIYSGVNSKFYKNSSKEFKELENIDKNIMLVICMMLVLINMVPNVVHYYDFGKVKVG